MRGIVAGISLFVVTTVLGCKVADDLTTKDETGQSPAEKSAKELSGVLPAPWGEILLGAVIVGQNTYLAISKRKQAAKTTG